jgi:hypothetical protein
VISLDWPFLARWLRAIAVGCIVAAGIGWLVIHLVVSPALSIDGRLYRGGGAWLAGGDLVGRDRRDPAGRPPPAPLSWLRPCLSYLPVSQDRGVAVAAVCA